MFKPLHSADWFYTEIGTNAQQSTTHEMLEMGIAKRKMHKRSLSKKINFQNFRIDRIQIDKPIEVPLTTSYTRDYAAPYDIICPSKTVQEDMPDRLFNRIPLNDFALESLNSSEFKFMDDYLINLSNERQKINLFRQIRNQHFPLV